MGPVYRTDPGGECHKQSLYIEGSPLLILDIHPRGRLSVGSADPSGSIVIGRILGLHKVRNSYK